MLTATFQHFSNMTPSREHLLWLSGIRFWQNILERPGHPNFTKKEWKKLKMEVKRSIEKYKQKDWNYFLETIPEELEWRLLPQMKDNILFFDVESTGLNLDEDDIVSIATFDGKEIRWFIKDENLEEFQQYLSKFNSICTFYGRNFDVPILEKRLGIIFNHFHFDLFDMSRQLGLHGGLKQLEHYLQFDRDELTGINGEHAIKLWDLYKETNDERYKKTLIAYNIEDIVNLEPMLYEFYNRLRKKIQMPGRTLKIPSPIFERPILPDENIIKELLKDIEIYD